MFIELRAKTNLSFLEAASDTRDYIRRAQELGMSAIGICDTNGVYGLPRALEAIRNGSPDVRLICGADLKIAGHSRLSLLAKSSSGWRLLCQLLTELHRGKEKGEGFLTIEQLRSLVEAASAGSELFCISDYADASTLGPIKEIFKDQTYLSLCRYADQRDRKRTLRTKSASQYFALPIIASNDVRYHIPEMKPLLNAFTSVRLGLPLDHKTFKQFPNRERYLKNDMQMRALFLDIPEIVPRTAEIASDCKFQISDIKADYPDRFLPPGETPSSYLDRLVFEGAVKRYGTLLSDKVATQIREELAIIHLHKVEGFFLSTYDICSFARSSNIYFNARGSAVNSIVCYSLFISRVDPVKFQLNLARFLSEDRNEAPDIDIDFEHFRREEVIQWVYQRFGRGSAALVSAIQTYKPDGATLDFSKALGAEVGTITAGALRKQLDTAFGDKSYRIKMLDPLLTLAMDTPRNSSTHPGGMLITSDLSNIAPVIESAMPGRTILQFDKNDIETLGLWKQDILSIGSLTAMRIACELIGITPDEIPHDCPATYAMLRRGETYGVFQAESRAQINTLPKTQVETFYDLVMQVSMIRPMASEGGMVKAILRRKFKMLLLGIPFKSGNAIVDEELARTYGVPLFPEQMMAVAKRAVGFTSRQCEQLRKSLGKMRSADAVSEIAKYLHKELLLVGVTKEFADEFFKHVSGYSSYGFPESHAVAYALILYLTGWLKCHYPASFLVGLLNAQPMGFYPEDCLIYDAQRVGGVEIRPIHPNLSDWEAKLEAPNVVRMGFKEVRGIREEPVRQMIKARSEKSFTSVEDFIARTNFSSDMVENLALGNIFECWRLDRRHTFWQTLEFHRLIKRDVGGAEQLSLFDARAANTPVTNLFSKMKLVSEQFLDYYILGYSPHGNPMRGLRQELPELPKITAAAVDKLKHNASVSIAGLNTCLQRPPPAKGRAFMTLEDETGTVSVLFQKDAWEKNRAEVEKSRFVIIEGKIQVERTQTKRGLIEQRTLVVRSCKAFGEVADSKPVRAQQHPKALGKISSEHAFQF